jgi:hypothetical protein
VGLDVESFVNFFCVSVTDFKSSTHTFIFDNYQDDRIPLIRLLDHFDHNSIEVVTFNGLHYDCPMLNFVRLNPKCTTEQIKAFSDVIINVDVWWQSENLKKYKYHHRWTDIDLFCYWAMFLRRAKKISLKGIGVQLRYPVIQELPIKSDSVVTGDTRPKIIVYNAKHDLGILKYMLEKSFKWQGKTTTYQEMIDLRKSAMIEYGFSKACMSWDAVKLGLNVALARYKDNLEPSTEFEHFGEVISDKIKFTKEQFCTVLKQLKSQHKSKPIDVTLVYNNSTYHIKQGGLHTQNNPKVYKERPGYIFHSLDVAGYYPALAEELRCRLHKGIADMRKERLGLKHKGLGKSAQANLLKLAANGTIGNFNQEASEVYDPYSFFKITLNGQLFLLMLLEQVVDIGCEIIMANTDGFELYVPEDKYDTFMTICKAWEEYTGFELEHFRYKALYLFNVNSYLGIFEDGSIKEKGWFVTDPDLGNKVDFLILPKALQAYIVNNIPFEESFRQADIYDFCGAQKVDRSYTVTYKGKTLPQRLNVYYASEKGHYLYKTRKNKNHFMPELKKVKVLLFNNFHEGPYDINYSFYKQKLEAKLQELQIDSPQLSLF